MAPSPTTADTAKTDPNCIFCKIVAGEIPAEIVADTDHSVAFRDLEPQAPTHILVIPKRHVPNAAALADASDAELGDVVRTAGSVAHDQELDDGYRLVFNTGEAAHQTVFHAHLHVLGGRTMQWPPG